MAKGDSVRVSYSYGNREGELINLLKEDKAIILSEKVRGLLWVSDGERYLKEIQASQNKRVEHLLECLEYHAGKVKSIEAKLQLEFGANRSEDFSLSRAKTKSTRAIANGKDKDRSIKKENSNLERFQLK